MEIPLSSGVIHWTLSVDVSTKPANSGDSTAIEVPIAEMKTSVIFDDEEPKDVLYSNVTIFLQFGMFGHLLMYHLHRT